MSYQRIAGTIALALILGGCVKDENPEGVIPEGYESAVEKAQGVEGTLQDAARTQLEQLDQTTE